jgi:hypothetical protein
MPGRRRCGRAPLPVAARLARWALSPSSAASSARCARSRAWRALGITRRRKIRDLCAARRGFRGELGLFQGLSVRLRAWARSLSRTALRDSNGRQQLQAREREQPCESHLVTVTMVEPALSPRRLR